VTSHVELSVAYRADKNIMFWTIFTILYLRYVTFSAGLSIKLFCWLQLEQYRP